VLAKVLTWVLTRRKEHVENIKRGEDNSSIERAKTTGGVKNSVSKRKRVANTG